MMCSPKKFFPSRTRHAWIFTARRILYIAKYAFVNRDISSLHFCGVLRFDRKTGSPERMFATVRKKRVYCSPRRVFAARGRLYLKRVGFFFVSQSFLRTLRRPVSSFRDCQRSLARLLAKSTNACAFFLWYGFSPRYGFLWKAESVCVKCMCLRNRTRTSSIFDYSLVERKKRTEKRSKQSRLNNELSSVTD